MQNISNYTTFKIAKMRSENITKISRDSFWSFWQILLKEYRRGILNSAILFRWSRQRSRASIHISDYLPRRKICFPGVGNGKWHGAVRWLQFQWLFLTFDPARPVTECSMSTIHRELSWLYPTVRHVQCIIDEPQSLFRINVKDVYASNIYLDIFSKQMLSPN